MLKSSRFSETKFWHLVKLFCLDVDAQSIADFTALNCNTVNRHLRLFRERIAEMRERSSHFSGEVEIDKSYFGARRIKGKRGQGARGKTPVFGILQRGGMDYTEIVPDFAKKTLQAIIRGKVNPDTVIHSDQWRGYNGLVDMEYKKHYRIRHRADEFARGKTHINCIESFCSFAKRRLHKFHGIPKSTFNLHLKECEFRFNHRDHNIHRLLLKVFRKKSSQLVKNLK
ncbi:IS1595 family transposase [Candidatus Latescibacterota bacterium]